MRQVVLSGALASLCSAAALALCGQIERGTWAGPNNGPSQWIWGRQAAYRRRASLRYTLVGYGIHHTMATGWAWLHEAVFGAHKREQSPAGRLARAAATSATAAFVDFQLTPQRLQPGFDAQLSRRSLFVVYAAFAIGLALSAEERIGRGRRAATTRTARAGGR